MGILWSLSLSHFLNDTIQSLLPAIYPLLKDTFGLSFVQVGLITLAFQSTASLLQPIIGHQTDRRPRPFSLATGMAFTLAGLLMLAFSVHYAMVVTAACMVGVGSAVFHPEASRVAKLASGGRHGFAQSVFQVGGNLGSSFGPLLAAAIVGLKGGTRILWFTPLAVAGIFVLSGVGRWYRDHLAQATRSGGGGAAPRRTLSRRRIAWSIAILLALIFSKFFYLASLTNYYTFYLIGRFGMGVHAAQLCLFVFLFSIAAGTLIGGPVGDRAGRKYVIWASVLGVAPFTLILPHVGEAWTVALTVPIGIILSSAMPAILVYAQELLPGRTGTVAGLFFGFAFGMGGIGSAVLGWIADRTSIGTVFEICSFLPLIGLLTGLLPDMNERRRVVAG